MAILEFGLVTPLFLVLCLGAIDFGRVFLTSMIVTGANRAGLQYAGSSEAASGDTTGITNIVKSAASNASGISVATNSFCTCGLGGTQVSCSNSCSGKVSYVQVTTTLTFQPVVAWPMIPNSVNVTSSGVTRVQ
jgi:Flp pilus assembly protein TadG